MYEKNTQKSSQTSSKNTRPSHLPTRSAIIIISRYTQKCLEQKIDHVLRVLSGLHTCRKCAEHLLITY